MTKLHLLSVASALCAGLSAQISMTHLVEIDVSNALSGIRNNPAAVPCNGVDLLVARVN